MQRQPQRPPPPHQGQPPRQQQQMNSPQRAPVEAGPRKDQSSSPQHQNPAKEHPRTADQSVLNGDNGKPPQHSPQQHHAFPPTQRPPNPQQPVGSGVGQHQHHGLAGHPVQSLPPRPHVIPGSPAQRPLGATELQAPGSTSGMQPRLSPAAQHQLPAHHQPFQAVQPGESEFKEPDEPLSDMDDNGFDEDDIEGGATTVSLSKEPASQVAGDRPPPSQVSAVAAQSTGPPAGPPTGPPRGPPRKLSSSAGSGPARVAQPAHDPTSPLASAFPLAGPPRLRARPPPANKEYTPYRPPERPSQAPVMYSQSGQPTLSQPLLRQDDTSKGQSSPATSMVPQGADAASSSVRPRDGSLQKRTFAGENNAPKADSSAKMSPSSALKTIKTWTIRGGLLYLGYTAVFSCRQEPTGVKGLYCKATNGIGGLVKPFVAPHYNAHLGPHVDRFIKPVVRQSHRVYLKVADPVVQGAMSAVGVVYESTAKKHVDSAKDQVISVLPYPFKRKSSGATDIDQSPDTHEETRSDEHPHVERVSRQPVHAEEIEEPVDEMQQISDDIESFVDAVKEAGAERLQEAIHTVQEEIADVNETILEAVPHHDDQTTVPEPDATEKMQSHEPQILEQTEESTSVNDVPEQGHHQDAAHHEQRDMNRQIIDEIAAFEDLPKDVHREAGENGSNDGNQVASATEDIKDEEPEHVEAQEPIPIPVPLVEPATEAIPITENAPELVTEPAEHHEPPTELPSTETAESTPEYLDQPTAASEDTVVETTFKPAEEVQFHEEIVVEAPAPTEEEHREQIPVATSEETHYATEEGNTEGTEVVFEETYEQDHKEPVGTEAILEQQAAPVSETGHDNMATAHDEL
ncbi:hypothetical protein BGZ98_001782 [Dissophora globulifera]|nr:hypothetical protein BGZ98_001782 [Dissophora globulifera]